MYPLEYNGIIIPLRFPLFSAGRVHASALQVNTPTCTQPAFAHCRANNPNATIWLSRRSKERTPFPGGTKHSTIFAQSFIFPKDLALKLVDPISVHHSYPNGIINYLSRNWF